MGGGWRGSGWKSGRWRGSGRKGGGWSGSGLEAGLPADLIELREPLGRLAAAAGRAVLEVYRGRFEVRRKGDDSLVTEADLRSQALLQAGLAEAWPGVPVLAEEAEPVPYEVRRGWTHSWSVDPLDGTREFVAHSGEFSINLGLVTRGRPAFGLIHAPAQDVTYAGMPGRGAWRRRGGGPWVPVRARPPDGRRLRVFVSRHHAGPRTLAWLRTLEADWEVEVVRHGSALKTCLVADGSAHLYARFGTTHEWDTAAAQAILEGAGGVVRRIGTREPLRYNKRDPTNPGFYAAWGPDAPHP